MTTKHPLLAAFRFFFEHSGYTVGYRAECALALARAEQAADTNGWTFEWIGDDDVDLSWLAPDQTVNEVLGCVLRNADGETLASLWGICDPDRTYGRIVQAELACEACSALEQAKRADILATSYMAL